MGVPGQLAFRHHNPIAISRDPFRWGRDLIDRA
jgi:hypothetical protein